jgi:ribonuclease HI
VVLENPGGDVVAELAAGIGWATNNEAEYQALIKGLELAIATHVEELVVVSDSRLLVQQMSGKFKVKSKGLKPLHARATELTGGLRSVRFTAVPRSDNEGADRLANEGIDEWLRENPYPGPPESPQKELF